MRVLDIGLAAHLAQSETTLATCWKLVRGDGVVLGFNDHDRALSFGGTDFVPAHGLDGGEVPARLGAQVETSEVLGVLSADDITEDDILLARYDGAVVVTSLAGRVARPRLPVGQVRVGGFGGIAGLAAYLAETRVRAVVDATHPFAEKISANAAAACPAAGVPLLRLERPGWAARPEASAWYWAGDHSEAARVAAGLGDRPFLTVGRQSLAHFVEPLRRHACLVRVVDEPDIVLPVSWKLLRSRGPYTLAHEREVMAGTDVLVTKDSGGDHTVAKLEVAAERAMPVVIVRRAGPPAGVPLVRDVDAALAWVRALPAP